MSRFNYHNFYGIKEDGSLDKEFFHNPEDLERVGIQVLREISTDKLILLPKKETGMYLADSISFCTKMEKYFRQFIKNSNVPEDLGPKEFEQIFAEFQVIAFETEEQTGKNIDFEDNDVYMLEALYVELYTDLDTIDIEE